MEISQDFLARENIKRFEALLESTTDEAQKSTIRPLLEKERRHLQEIRGAEKIQPH